MKARRDVHVTQTNRSVDVVVYLWDGKNLVGRRSYLRDPWHSSLEGIGHHMERGMQMMSISLQNQAEAAK